jgi:chemotaxis protein histidine kinase CheA
MAKTKQVEVLKSDVVSLFEELGSLGAGRMSTSRLMAKITKLPEAVEGEELDIEAEAQETLDEILKAIENGTEIVIVEEDDAPEPLPTKKAKEKPAKGKKAKIETVEDEDEEEEEEEEEPAPKKRGRPAKAKEEEKPAPKKRGRPAKVAEEVEEEEEEEDDEPAPKVKKAKKDVADEPRNARMRKTPEQREAQKKAKLKAYKWWLKNGDTEKPYSGDSLDGIAGAAEKAGFKMNRAAAGWWVMQWIRGQVPAGFEGDGPAGVDEKPAKKKAKAKPVAASAKKKGKKPAK